MSPTLVVFDAILGGSSCIARIGWQTNVPGSKSVHFVTIEPRVGQIGVHKVFARRWSSEAMKVARSEVTRRDRAARGRP